MNLRLNTPDPATEAVPGWSERNRAWLLDAFGRLAEGLAAGGSDRLAAAGPEADPRDFVPALAHCAAAFGLSPFERALLLLAAGIELDSGVRAALAGPVTFGLAFRLLADPHWDALSPDAPLRRWGLVEPERGVALAQATLRIDERILHFLTGVAAEDPAIAALARPTDTLAAEPHPLAERLRPLLDSTAPSAVVLHGDAGECRDLALAAAAAAGRAAVWLAGEDLQADAATFADLARRLDREALLVGALPVLAVDGGGEAAALALAARLRGAFVWLGSPATSLTAQPAAHHVARFELPPPDAARTRARLAARWRQVAVGAADARLDAALERAGGQFHLGQAGLDAVTEALRTAPPADRAAAVWAAARAASRGGLDALARRIDTRVRFDDLVLPSGQMAILREIAGQIRHREQVWRDWGFGSRHALGQGLVALFCGESGTGKTLAAEAIASEAELDLYRVDLSATVSKYIGETEKNLRRLFDEAEAGGAVLLFDEADALFGRRSEVRDSHDRYANVEIAYLLQRIEAYRGLAVLTTNMKSAIDRAFLRRIRFVVPFPFPDAAARELIWRRQFPPAAPVGAIDIPALARLNLPGGNIRGIAIRAAFKAAAADAPIDQAMLMEAAREEFTKLERPLPDLGRAAR